jgi:hypothetical protein
MENWTFIRTKSKVAKIIQKVANTQSRIIKIMI